MRPAATFLATGANPMDLDITNITQTAGESLDLTVGIYDDNVTRQRQYQYIMPADVDGEDIKEAGWYLVDNQGDVDIEGGVQSTALPYGQGCVIVSGNSAALYSSAGIVDSIAREFSVTAGARKMMGNVLPRSVTLSEITQVAGNSLDLTIGIYDNNVTRLRQYQYIMEEDVDGEDIKASGWYLVDNQGDVDIESGVQNMAFASGDGFVVVSGNSNAVLKFPRAY